MRRLLLEAAVFAMFLAEAALVTRPLAADLVTTTLATGDPLKDSWTLHWLLSHLGRPRELFTGNTFHPSGVAVVCSDVMLGTAVLLAPLWPWVRDPIPLYNLGVLLAFAFTGWSFHALVLHLTSERWAAVMTGTLAAFGSHQLAHVYHLPLLNTGWLALFLLGLHRLVRRPSASGAILAGVSAALVIQTSGYYAVAALALAIVFVAVHARLLRRRALLALAAAAAIATVLSLPFLAAYLAAHRAYHFRRPPGVSRELSFQPGRDLGSRAYVYRWALDSEGERLFPGLLSLSFAVVAVARRRPAAGCYAAMAATMLVLGLGPELRLGRLTVPLPYALLTSTPPLEGMRHPFTFAAVGNLTLAVLAGLGVASLRLRPPASAALALLAFVETVGPPPRVQRVEPGVPPVFETLRRLPAGTVLDLPVLCFECMVWAARHGLPVINGQASAFVPPQWLRLDRMVRSDWLSGPVRDLDSTRPLPLLGRFSTRYVIVPVGRRPDLSYLAKAFDRSGHFRLAATAVSGDRVYEVAQPMRASPGNSREK